MTGNELTKPSQRGQSMPRDDRPKLGEWYWVTCEDEKGKPDEKLLCVTHLASNHVKFSECGESGYRSTRSIRYRDLAARTRIEAQWREVLDRRIAQKRDELNAKVREICDAVQNAGLINNPSDTPTLLPTLARQSPEAHKQALIRLKEKDMPALQNEVKAITQEIAALHRMLILPQDAEMQATHKAMDGVDKRLFALELYAGLFQKCLQIRKGEPAPKDTPVSVRQMLRYMDEECLIDYGGGGMDYQKLEDFDDWVVKDENLNRLAPEPRCLVAMRVRRHAKDYGPVKSIAQALDQIEMHEANAKTYLLIRNGTQVYRLWADIQFEPRLLPLQEEFLKPFTKREYRWNAKKKCHDDTYVPITPDDLDYDEHVEKRLDNIYKYNRIMFLVQGLLDRSECFHPHPAINLADQEHVERWLNPVFDEEKGLPSANPPTWESYRDTLNAKLKKGDYVYSTWYDDETDYEFDRWSRTDRIRESRRRPETIMCVDSMSRDKSKVRVSWPWGERRSYWRLSRWERRCVSDTVDRICHAWLPVKEVFNVSAYKPGDFKQFLCDAYLKGAYLKWAPPLLAAEKWHKAHTPTS